MHERRKIENESEVDSPVESLDKVALEVTALYFVGMQSETLLDLEELEDREKILEVGDKKWDRLAQENTDYSDKILALRNAIKMAKRVQWSEEPEMRYAIMEFFRRITDETAQCLLTDILMYRASRETGEIGSGRSVYREAVPMFEELGIPKDEMFSEHVLQLPDIAKSVLNDQLQLEPHSESRGRFGLGKVYQIIRRRSDNRNVKKDTEGALRQETEKLRDQIKTH